MSYREIRVRPVIRYIITEFNSDEQGSASSETWGEFDNVDRANVIANRLAYDHAAMNGLHNTKVVEAPKLTLQYKGEAWQMNEVDPDSIKMVQN